MKPQGKVTIFMVVMIVMLSIYYFALPNKGDKVKDTEPNTPVVNKSAEFERLRNELDESRETMIDTLQGVLASVNVGVDEKNQALESIQVIQTLAQNENLLETQITNLGYDDAFVKASDTGEVTISVLANEHSVEDANQLILMAIAQFGAGSNVVIQFVPLEVN